jgi:hypothetical protein
MMTCDFAPVLALAAFTMSAMPTLTVRAQTHEVINDSEVYAVYASAVQTKLREGEKPLIALTLLQETRAGADCVTQGNDKKLQPEWRSVVDSYRRENARVQTIRGGFDLGVPYSIITLAQLRKLMRDAGYSERSPRSNALGADVFARFPGGRLVALSAVGFNAEKTRAMVAVQADCFPSWTPGTEHAVCHEGRHVALEKQDGRWTVVPGVRVGCIWVA